MFTGLVERAAAVARVTDGPEARRISVAVVWPQERRGLGASVSVSGVCLTVVESRADELVFDVAFETLRRTTLGRLGAGDRVNLEPSLRLGDALGGHLVSGHVDGVATVRSLVRRGEARELWLDAPPDLRRFLAEKGSACADGVSLTINRVDAEGFMVGLIPHTLEVTTLGERRPGDAVNLEVDLLARYVARLLESGRPAAGGVTLEQLTAAGFITAPEVS